MGRLLAFLYAYRNLIWFIAIQAISVWLLASYNNAHTLVFNSWGDSLANAVASTNAAVSGYFNLAEEPTSTVSPSAQPTTPCPIA